MNERERILAQALGRMHGSNSAGVGVREAMRALEDRIKSDDVLAAQLRQHMREIEDERRTGEV